MSDENQNIRKLTPREAEELRQLVDTGANEDLAIVIQPKVGVVGTEGEQPAGATVLSKVSRFQTHYRKTL